MVKYSPLLSGFFAFKMFLSLAGNSLFDVLACMSVGVSPYQRVAVAPPRHVVWLTLAIVETFQKKGTNSSVYGSVAVASPSVSVCLSVCKSVSQSFSVCLWLLSVCLSLTFLSRSCGQLSCTPKGG